MKRNHRNKFSEHNQDLPYNDEESINNNVPTMANNNLIDISDHASQAYDLSKPDESTRTDPRHNIVLRTNGAKKIIIKNKGSSYQFEPSKIQTEGINYAPIARSSHRLPTVPHNPAFQVPRGELNIDRESQANLVMFEDISSVESESNDNNEVERNYPPLDDFTMFKFDHYSFVYKIIVVILMKHLIFTVLPHTVPIPSLFNNTPEGRCTVDAKGLNGLIQCFFEIIVLAPMLVNKSVRDKLTQTEPTVDCNKSTQTNDGIWHSLVPRVNISTNTSKAHLNNQPRKEQAARSYHNVEVSNQSTNVYNNQQEQFYDNQQFLPQLPMNQNYVMQTPETNRNNMQPMMQYGMPHPSNAMMQLQRADLGNNVVQTAPAMNQYGIPHNQISNANMQRADHGMTVLQMPQAGIPQHDPSVAKVQLADVYRNRMQTMMQPRSYNHPNATVTATIARAYYHQNMSANVPTQQMPRETRRKQPVTQTVTRATASTSGRGRHRHGYAAPSPPYPPYPQWQMSAHQDQFRKN